MFVSGVLHSTDGTVSLVQAVDSLNLVAIAGFVLELVVAGVGVFYFVLELVFRVSLGEDRRLLSQ